MGIFDKIKKAVFGEKQEETLEKHIEENEKEAIDLTETDHQKSENDSMSDSGITNEDIEEAVRGEENEPVHPETPEKQAEIDEDIDEAVEAEVDATEMQIVEKTPEPEIEEPSIQKVEETVEVEPQNTTDKYDKGLEKSRKTFGSFMNKLFANFRMVDDEFFEDLEEALIGADVGFDVAMRISDELQEEVKLKNVKKQADIEKVIVEKLVELYDADGEEENNAVNLQTDGPTIILFVGVNGVGKTTSIGKLAYRYKQEGKKVLLAAADTFRAGAIDQLVVWGERAGVEVVRHAAGSDPAAVVFDAVDKTKKEGYDVLLVDTAGRLQNKVNLMKELEKMKRIIEREYPSAPHEVLLVVDATTGQNALIQAKQFKDTTDVTGIVLSKLDGTAKGGIVLAIRNELHLPVKLVGLGEGINDLENFEPNQFVYGLFKDVIEQYA
ncbi:signal recognition particle-docking protein FtsY [Vagococcus penaei]|uniref:Signal recognition particle receptor FtsY n=1 Tax=Vagococcus penaei TaxID=633807 RepID=A0A1Q2D6Z9_9ENTE|nr:signal recognition particle-docking protein FtsY [Vagococcus penaei]AQP54081.1 signal recognition particle-docking protein FtsY [Vagococcus penaei]RST98489.1 signal recognition particle-docking protein FtsY [Vagococcus penaei]